MNDLLKFVQKKAKNGLISWKEEQEAHRLYDHSFIDIEKLLLENNIMPARYQRNLNTITIRDQLTLLNSKICVIGAGGLGAYIIEELARLGVGNLTIFDFDTFEEHNLNRQLYSQITNLDKNKTLAAETRIKSINPAINITCINESFNSNTNVEYFAGASVVIDAVDNIQTKKVLGTFCNENNLCLVHGAIAGWYGQIAIQAPGQNTIGRIYKNATYEKGIETEMGNPAFTPAVIASIQVSEAIKILLNKKEAMTNKVYFVDLLSLKISEITY